MDEISVTPTPSVPVSAPIQQNPPTIPAQSPKKTIHLPKLVFYSILLLILILLAALIMTIYHYLIAQKSNINPPISLTAPEVASFAYAYRFNGTFKEVKQTENGTELITTLKDKYPEQTLTLTPKTKISISENNSLVPSDINNLKTGDRISINATYNSSNKLWTLAQIVVYKK